MASTVHTVTDAPVRFPANPKEAALIWATIAERLGRDPHDADVRELAAALGCVDQPVWRRLGHNTGVAGRRRIR